MKLHRSVLAMAAALRRAVLRYDSFADSRPIGPRARHGPGGRRDGSTPASPSSRMDRKYGFRGICVGGGSHL